MDITAQNIKVLIVEDHFLSRQVITVALRDKGVIHMEAVSDGQKAIEAIDKATAVGQPFHLVFLDWEMPVTTGIDVLRHFRASPAYNNTAFVMVTAVAEKKNVMDAVKAGVSGYIVKPVSQTTLGKKFDEILGWLKTRRG